MILDFLHQKRYFDALTAINLLQNVNDNFVLYQLFMNKTLYIHV